MHQILFGQEDGAHVLVRIGSVEADPMFPDYRGVSMNVQIVAGTFRAHSAPFAYFSDFSRFETEMHALERSLSGRATFAPQDNEFEVTLIGDGLGHIAITGFLAENAHHDSGSVLRFNMSMDQTFLPPILAALREFVATHQLPSTSSGSAQ
jgi:hypothetical protein